MQLQDSAAVPPSLLSESYRFEHTSGSTHTRRRVNPDSLAVRLGPELIKELESLLVPGSTEMPPFAARQEIQKRYNIDRRHIYDWYHTKGLRVSSRESGERVEKTTVDCRDLRPRIKRKLKPALDIVEKSSATAHLNFGSTCEDLPAIPSAPLGYFGGFVGYHPGSHLPGFPLQCFFDSPPYRNPPIPPPVVFRPQAASGSSDNPKPCSPAPEFPVNHTDLTNWQPLSHEGSQSAAEYNPWRQAVNPLYPMYNEQPLPQEQREAYYQQFAEALGPAYGVQESVGTYRAYMTQQVQTYYERLVPPRSSGGVPGPYSQALLPTPVSVAVSTRTPSGGYTSRASTPHLPRPPNGVRPSGGLGFSQPRIIAHNNANSGVSSRSSVSSVSTPVSSESSGGTSFWPWAASHPGDSEPPLDISELLESPILRSRSSSQENSPSSESSALPTPDTQDFTSDDLVTVVSACLSEESPRIYVPSEVFSLNEQNPFSVNLRTAKETQGLEKMVIATASRDKNRLKKSRPRRTTSNSAGGGI